jgi:succinate dehydrogenase/fumarate reductase flavoprotein subunit
MPTDSMWQTSLLRREEYPNDVSAGDADVVVVGAGPGGLAAAVAAADEGATVLVLEALDEIGGNAIWSTGYLAFCDFAMQHEAGIADNVEAFLADAAAEVERQRDRYGIVWDRELTRLYAERSSGTYDFLRRYGVTFERFIRRPQQHTVDRMVDLTDTFSIQRAFQAALDERGVAVWFGRRARRLLVRDGRVAGVVAEHDGRDEDVHARRGVVLATGGYQAGVEVRRRYQPEHLAATPYLGVATCRGDGHVMGERIGGALFNMTMIQPLVIVASALVEDSIAVNADGRRFHDEAGPYDDRVAALLVQPDRLAHYVFDGRTAADKRDLVDQMPAEAVEAASLDELAARIGCPARALTETVTRWNATLADPDGADDDFGRVVLPAGRRGITDPPFSAARMVIGVNFPAGGFRTTSELAVVDLDGAAIPGLWAAGDTVAGVNPCLGLGGIHICSALTLGFVAGAAAAAGRTGDVRPLPPLEEPPPPRATTRMAIVEPGRP